MIFGYFYKGILFVRAFNGTIDVKRTEISLYPIFCLSKISATMKQPKLQALFKNFKIKIIVLVLAILLWFYVITENEYQYVMDIPIRPENIRQGKVIVNEYPQIAKVLLLGRGKNLLNLVLEGNIELIFNLSQYQNRDHVELRKEHVSIPRHSQVEVVQIVEPDSIEIILGNLEKKRVPVRAQIRIKPYQGYTQVGDYRLEPDSVWLQGPEKFLEQIDCINTEPYEIAGVKKKLSDFVPLIAPKQKKITMLTNRIQFSVDIQKLMEKRVTGVPVKVRNVPSSIKIIVIPSHLSLTLEGGVELLANITEKDITAYIDYRRKRMPNEIGHPAYIETPPGIRTRDVTPQKFKLAVER